MSAWRTLIQALYRTGKPAAHRKEFDTFPRLRDFDHAQARAQQLGFLARAESGRWVLTPLGRDYIEGRAALVPRSPGGGVRGPIVVRATWLASLPRPEQINHTTTEEEPTWRNAN